MAHQTLDADELRRGLQSLPQELYDQIYAATFTAPPGVRDLGNAAETRQNLNLLQVSSGTRALYATTYYGGATFELESESTAPHKRVGKWLESLSKTHSSLFHQVRAVINDPGTRSLPGLPSMASYRNHFREQMYADVKWEMEISVVRMYVEILEIIGQAQKSVTRKVFLKVNGKMYGYV